MAKLDTIELFIDENADKDGIEALSLVKFPATEETWVALNNHRIEFKSIDDEKRIIIGLALVPDKLIYRRNGDYEYNITFSKETVNKAARLYLKKLNNNNATLEHKTEVDGVSVVESWTVENPKMDKTALYDLNAVEGSWAVIMSIDNDKVWQEIKNGTYLGISVEGYFSDEQKLSAQNKEEKLIKLIKELILADEKKKVQLAKISFDYDSTLSTAKGTELAKRLLAEGNDIYIISARHLKNGMLNKAKDLGIPLNRVYATGSNVNKIAKVKSLKIETHYDNNENVVKQLEGIGKLFKND